MPCIKRIAPVPFFPGMNQPCIVEPDSLGNSTELPSKSEGNFPIGSFAGALKKVPANHVPVTTASTTPKAQVMIAFRLIS
jgi:hypothetical protein